MKNKIIIFLVGLLLGAIISTGSIYVYTVASSKSNNANMQMFDVNGTRGGMMDINGTGGTDVPEKPDNMPDDIQKGNPDANMR